MEGYPRRNGKWPQLFNRTMKPIWPLSDGRDREEDLQRAIPQKIVQKIHSYHHFYGLHVAKKVDYNTLEDLKK